MLIHVHNWRCFSSQKFEVPLESMVITDQNGSGKTSLLSAIYTLFTGTAWPGTKLAHHLKSNALYFGISTNTPEWAFTGKVNPSGRISTKLLIPDDIRLAFSDVDKEKQIELKTRPAIFTYLPSDNYILSSARSQKLTFFDNLIIQQKNLEYEQALTHLNKILRNKQQLIKYSLEQNLPPDTVLVHTLNEQIVQLSNFIWQTRARFFHFIDESLPRFSTWIDSPLHQWKIVWEITNKKGLRSKVCDYMLPYVTVSELNALFSRELQSGTLLFGAQRDDIRIESNHIPAENALSRGEMRLFILFLKHQAQQNTHGNSWFFLDDVFNEFDTRREHILFQEVLRYSNLFIATSTQSPAFSTTSYTLDNLTIR